MRVWSLFLLAAVLLTAGFGLWKWREAIIAATRRAEAWEYQQRIEATEAALDQPIELTDRWLSLFELPEAIERATGLQVELDAKNLEEEGVKAETPLARIRGRFSSRTALGLLLEPLNLDYDVRDGRIVIGSRDNSDDWNDLRTVVYPLPQPDFAASAVDLDHWLDLVTTLIRPEAWDGVGGPGYCEAVPGGLVIVQTERIHRQIRQSLAALGQLRSPPESFASVPIAPFLTSQADRRILAALAEPTAIDADRAPLSLVMSGLAKRHGIPIVLDEVRLSEAGVNTEVPITLSLAKISLASVLRTLLESLELTYLVRHKAIVVTTHEVAESPDNLPLVAHPVHDLVEWSQDGQTADYDSLIDLITTTIAPESWSDVGGPGSLHELDGWLLLSQTHEVHSQIELLFSQLRRALSYQSHPLALGIDGDERPSERRLRAALAQEIAVRYVEEPLNLAIENLSERLAIPIILNARKLEEAGVNVDTPVTCELASAPLANQLRLLLDPLDLTYMIRDEVLKITTPEDAESADLMEHRIYDTRPLFDADLGVVEPDPLVELLTTLVTSEDWASVGGPASIKCFRGLLVVAHTQRGHEQVQRLLVALEEHCLHRFQSSADRPWIVAVDRPPAYERIRAILATPIDVNLRDEPLDRALAQLAAKHALPLVFDSRRLNEAGVDLQSPVAIELRSLTLLSVLRQIFDEHELACQIRDGVVVVTTEEGAERDLPLVAYRVDDLIAGQRVADWDSLIDMITTVVAPESWIDVGGPGALRVVGNWLLVGQTLEAHEQIERLLADIRRRTTVVADAASVGADSGGVRHAATSAQGIRSALGRNIAFDFHETPLKEAIAQIAADTGIPLVISVKRLEEAGVNFDTPVAAHLAAAPLGNQLRLLLDPLDLTVVIRNEALLVTTPEDAEAPEHMAIRVHDTRQLLHPKFGITSSDGLDDLVTTLIQPEGWVDQGGPGSIKEFRGQLVVSHTDAVQRQVELLLAALSNHCTQQVGAAADRPWIVDVDASPVEHRIEQTLDRLVDVEFAGVPLDSVLKQLAATYALPLMFNEKGLDEAGVDRSRPVSIVARRQTLGAVLDRLLNPLDATYVLRDRVLMLTNPERAERILDLRLYKVRDLVTGTPPDLTRLADFVQSATHESWTNSGGPAAMGEIETGWLAIAADHHLHHRVADLLSQLRTGSVPQRELERRALAAERASADHEAERSPAPAKPADNPFSAPLDGESRE